MLTGRMVGISLSRPSLPLPPPAFFTRSKLIARVVAVVVAVAAAAAVVACCTVCVWCRVLLSLGNFSLDWTHCAHAKRFRVGDVPASPAATG